jgi:hypothetical protein
MKKQVYNEKTSPNKPIEMNKKTVLKDFLTGNQASSEPFFFGLGQPWAHTSRANTKVC